MSTGTIISWEKNEGDEIIDGDVLAQVETDKATMDMDSATSGYMAKIVVPAGTKDIPLGRVSSQTQDLINFANCNPEAEWMTAVL